MPRAKMQIGASFGVLRMAYQSSQGAMDVCEEEKFALVRPVGTASRAQSAPRADLTRWKKVCYFPCCALAAHVARTPTYAIGEFNPSKARALAT